MLILYFLFPFPLLAFGLESSDEIAILRSELKSLRSELDAFKLENKRPEQALENEEVILHWLKRNVMDLRREVANIESQTGEEARRSLGKEEELRGVIERELEGLRSDLKELQRDEEGLKSLGSDIQSNIQFYNRLMSPKTEILDSKVHIRSKKQMSKELKRMIATINIFFKRLSNLEIKQGEMESQCNRKHADHGDYLKSLEKRFFDQVQGLKNVSLSTFSTINQLEHDLKAKISESSSLQHNSSLKKDKILSDIISRQNDLEASIGEILRKFNYLLDAHKYHEEESHISSS